MNGVLAASADDIVGTFRVFDIDQPAAAAGTQAVAVQVYAPHDLVFPSPSHDTDLAISFIDWSPYPPDANMGLWREVVLTEGTPLLQLRYPLVSTSLLDGAQGIRLALMLACEVANGAATAMTGTLTASLTIVSSSAAVYPERSADASDTATSITVFVRSKPITVPPHSDQLVTFTTDAYPQLVLSFVTRGDMLRALWWPWQMGSPTLQQLTVSFEPANGASNAVAASFDVCHECCLSETMSV